MVWLAEDPPVTIILCRGGELGGRMAAMRDLMDKSWDSRMARGCASEGIVSTRVG